MSWLSDFMHPGRAYKDAEDEYRAGMGRARDVEQPFIQGGQQALPQLQESIQKLLNPQGMEDEFASGYETSPYAKDLMERTKQQGLDAASSQGLLGSSAATENIERGAGSIVSQDRQQYMNDLMQKYLSGVQGLQNIYGTGAGMAGQLGQQEIQAGDVLGDLEGKRRQAGANMFGNILGGVGELGMDYLTGGMGTGSFGRGSLAPSWMGG